MIVILSEAKSLLLPHRDASLPDMAFANFHGNDATVKALRCLRKPITDGLPDFCGECDNCLRLAACDDLTTRVDEAVAAREEMRDADKKDTRILIQSDPDVLI